MAARFLTAVPRWRSRQLKLAFSLPPTNQRACGGFQASTFFQGLNQAISRAREAQKASGFRRARASRRGVALEIRRRDRPRAPRRAPRPVQGAPGAVVPGGGG